MVEQQTLVISFSTALIFAAAVYIFCRLSFQVELRSLKMALEERDRQSAALKVELNDLKAATESERRDFNLKIELAHAELRKVVAEKARLEGELSGLHSLEQSLKEREQELSELRQKVLTLTADLNRVQEEVENAHRTGEQLIAAKEQECKAILAEKEAHIEEQKQLLANAESRLKEAFASLSVNALTTVSKQFIENAKATFETVRTDVKGELRLKQQDIEKTLKPVAEAIAKLQAQHDEIEKRRIADINKIENGFASITRQAEQLANALRKPNSRGAWAEMNLKTILDNAGLTQGVNYDLQDTTEDDGVRQRTDVIIHLPNGRDFIIDSKAPLECYWDGMNCENEEEKKAKFSAHARQVREHVKQLASKAYWSRYKTSPDCVVMFLPTEGAYMAALESDPALLTDAQAQRVYIANPMTLVNMIHVTAYVLQEESFKQNAHEVQAIASELYDRLHGFVQKFQSVGSSMLTTVKKYNQAVGSLEGRVIPQARKMNALGIGGNKMIDSVNEVSMLPRSLATAESKLHSDLALNSGEGEDNGSDS